MRLIVSLLTAVCFIAAAEASATGVATPQSQAPPKLSTIDLIRQPSLLRQKLTGNCTTTCQWIGGQQFCNTHCFVIILSADTLRQPKPSLGKPWEGICFGLYASGRISVAIWPASAPWLLAGGRSAAKGVIEDNCFAAPTAAPVSCCAGRSRRAQWACAKTVRVMQNSQALFD
jgi:hypothetical protein